MSALIRKIFVTGTRGIPDIPGGVEKHCQELYPLIAKAGHEVILATRTPYVQERLNEWHGVTLSHIYAPHKKSLEAIVHTLLAVLKARMLCPDIVHIHAVGPGLMVPLARLLGLKVVVTNHGPDYDRQKWGRAAKFVLRLGEKWGGRWANEIIVISEVIRKIISDRCDRDSNLIYNGVPLPELSNNHDFLDRIGARPGRYLLAVARFVPEKGLTDLMEAFQKLKSDYQLVIAGDADHETDYSRQVKKMATENDQVILTGYITGEELNQVFSHARLFVLPSYHEGLPIALLEAMSYGLAVLVSDIPANKEVALPEDCYFRCGDIASLAEKINFLLALQVPIPGQTDFRRRIIKDYNWEKIAEQTIAVYEKAVG